MDQTAQSETPQRSAAKILPSAKLAMGIAVLWSAVVVIVGAGAHLYVVSSFSEVGMDAPPGSTFPFVLGCLLFWGVGLGGIWVLRGRVAWVRPHLPEEIKIQEIHRELQQSRHQFRVLFESMIDGVIVVDTESHRMLLANPAACRMLACAPSQIENVALLDFDAGGGRDAGLAGLIARAGSGKASESLDVRLRRKDGVEFPANISAALMALDGQALVVLVLRDVAERTRVEAALRESEARYRMLFDNIRGGVALYSAVDDGADFELVEISEAGATLCEVRRDVAIGQRVTAIFPGISKFGLLQSMKEVWLSGMPQDLPLGVYEDDRIRRWFENHLCRLPSGLVAVLFEDTSKQRLAQEALKESESHHRHLVEAIPDILYRYSRQAGLVYASPQIRTILGIDPLDKRHRGGWHGAVHEEDQLLLQGALQDAAKEQRFDVEYRVKDSDGTWRWFRDRSITCQTRDGDLIIEGIASDITRQKEVEANQEHLSRAIEQTSEVVVITDARGTIQYVNPAYEHVTGYTREEAIGQNPRVLKSGEHDDAFYDDMWRTLKEGQIWEGRIVNKRKDGSRFTEEGSITPVLDARQRITHFVAVKRDITAHLALQEEKGKIEEQFRQSQKMEAVGQLAGGVAHDFNNLLQVINGYADLANEYMEPESPAHESLRQVLKAGERAATLVRQLLAFSRRQVMRPDSVHMGGLVRDLLNMLDRVTGEAIRLEIQESADLDHVRADRGMLEQVLLNLCCNARDSMPEGGVITLAVENCNIDAAFVESHPWANAGTYVRLRVADTGCGIAPQSQARLFEPFFTTKPTGEGAGMGLSMIYGIVKQHGGIITCDSTVGKGTTFDVYLPGTARGVEKGQTKVRDDAPGGTETILVVEDDRMVRKLGRSILERAGYTVLTAEDGLEAVECFQEQQDIIDLVLMDVVMPNMGGKEAHERIQLIRPGTPTLFASGYTESDFRESFLRDESLRLIQKPFSRKVMLNAVREALDATRV